MVFHVDTEHKTSLIEGDSVFDVNPDLGFLPTPDPLLKLPAHYAVWDEIAHDLPKLLVAGKVRDSVDSMPLLDAHGLITDHELNRAMVILSFLGHAYVWGEEPAAIRIPSNLAVPWHGISKQLGRLPVLSYASYALWNWRRVDPVGPVALGNTVVLQNFLGGIDEEWFILVHVDIEAKAAPALAAITETQMATAQGQPNDVERSLAAISSSLQEMYSTLLRIPERCDPYIYFNRVRPYIHGWRDHPAIPDGIVYEGVDEYGGKPQRFRGETGAQSSIVPSLDAALGISHEDDPLRLYLAEMRDYMPAKHRSFIEAVEAEAGPSIRDYVIRRKTKRPSLREAYNSCVELLTSFRSKHLEYAARYIFQQSQRDPDNPNVVGTGGTPFMPYLKKHRDETTKHLI